MVPDKLPKNIRHKNVVTAFKPVLVVSMLFGVCTVKIASNGKRYTQSYFATGLTLLILTLTIFHLLVIPKTVINLEQDLIVNETLENVQTFTSQHFIIKIVKPSIISTVTILIRALTLFKMHKFLPKIFETLSTTDELLKIKPKVIRKNVKVLLLAIAILLSVSILYKTCSTFLIDATTMHAMLMFFGNFYNNLGTSFVELQFIGLCYLIKSRFGTVDEKLTILREQLSKRSRKFLLCKTVHFDDYYVIEKISILRVAYKNLMDATVLVNELFNVQLMLSLFLCVLNALLQFYYAIFGGYNIPVTEDDQSQPLDEVLVDIMWACYYFKRFFAICYAATLMSKQAKCIRMSIYKLLNESNERDVQEELNYMLDYSRVHSPKIIVCELLQLDLKVIVAAIASGIIYLVILAQFHHD